MVKPGLLHRRKGPELHAEQLPVFERTMPGRYHPRAAMERSRNSTNCGVAAIHGVTRCSGAPLYGDIESTISRREHFATSAQAKDSLRGMRNRSQHYCNPVVPPRLRARSRGGTTQSHTMKRASSYLCKAGNASR